MILNIENELKRGVGGIKSKSMMKEPHEVYIKKWLLNF